ncbi:MAG: hypothetical protein WCD11_35905 [Solirubrobacteraceae bacterium]
MGQLLGLPGEASPPPGSDFLFGVLNGLYWLTVNLADRNPVLLVLDDAQWSDGSSLAWLSFLRARMDELQVAVVIAARRVRAGDGARGARERLRVSGASARGAPGGLSACGDLA